MMVIMTMMMVMVIMTMMMFEIVCRLWNLYYNSEGHNELQSEI